MSGPDRDPKAGCGCACSCHIHQRAQACINFAWRGYGFCLACMRRGGCAALVTVYPTKKVVGYPD